MSSQHNPFFIVGNERSGTTMLRLMLNEHSRLHVPPDTLFIPELVDRFALDPVLSSDDVAAVFDVMTHDRYWRRWQPDDAKIRELLHQISTPHLCDVVAAVYEYSCKGEHKVRWGHKTPTYLAHIEEIHRLFPRAKFVHIIRDPRDVCISMLRVGWHGNTMRQIAQRWRDQVEFGRRVGRSLGPQLYLEIFYEDLVLNSSQTLEQICDFLGETFEPQMLEFYKAARQIQTLNLEIHQKTVRPPQASDVSRWRTELNALQVIVIENTAGDLMRELDFERKYSNVLLIIPKLFGSLIWFAEFTLPIRRRLGIHFPTLSGRL